MLTTKEKTGGWIWIVVATALCFQWIIQKHLHLEPEGIFAPIFPGIAIFGAAFILSWASELAQIEIPRAVAFALLALVAVLPEYAVDMYFSWMAARDTTYAPYPIANMTGANRLLIGLGWSVIVLTYFIKTRKKQLVLDPVHKLEIKALLLATLYSFILSMKKTLSLLDAAILLTLFGWYFYRAIKSHVTEPELGRPAEIIEALGKTPRRILTIMFFALAGYTIFISAEPFSEGLLESGKHLGVEEFILVQWIAPLASESPEFIVAIIFAVRGLPNQSFSTMLSSKINQWTLLVGMIPIIYAVSGMSFEPLHLDERQIQEIFLTSSQSLFAVAVLSNYIFSIWEAITLLVLFVTQLCFPSPILRYIYATVYLLLTIIFLLASKSHRNSIVIHLKE